MKTDKTKNDCVFLSRSWMPLGGFKQLSTWQHQVSMASRTAVLHTPKFSEAIRSAQQDHVYMVFLKEILKHTHTHTPLLQRRDLNVKYVTFRRITSSQIITFVIELESTSCQPWILQHTLVMARQNFWWVRPDEFWNPMNRYKSYLHKIHRLKWVLALHTIWLSKVKNPQSIVITYMVLTRFSNFSHCPNKPRAITKHPSYIQQTSISSQNERLRNPLSYQ